MDPKRWESSKTLIANALVIVLAALGAIAEVAEAVTLTAPAVVAAINLVLRLFTGTPIAGSPADTTPTIPRP